MIAPKPIDANDKEITAYAILVPENRSTPHNATAIRGKPTMMNNAPANRGVAGR
jgi:hypothetical protein